jgi:hypothetical protein
VGRPSNSCHLPASHSHDASIVTHQIDLFRMSQLMGYPALGDRSERPLVRRMSAVPATDRDFNQSANAGLSAVIARRDPGGMVTMASKPYLVIPAALRRRCGLRPGDRVLLAVFPAPGRAGRVLLRGGGPRAAGAPYKLA